MSQQQTNPFHGAFVFRDQGHGILSSTYFNTDSPKPYPETAILKSVKDDNDPFIGTFETVWLEHVKHYKVILNIEAIDDRYHLKWMNGVNSTTLEYQGLAYMEGDKLVGCYWKI